MAEQKTVKAAVDTPAVLQRTFAAFRDYVAEVTGPKKAAEFAAHSYQTILKYFRNLTVFRVDKKLNLVIQNGELSDREILAFSIWMLQFIKEMQRFMIGVGHFDPLPITREMEPALRSLGFYEYFEQARELNY